MPKADSCSDSGAFKTDHGKAGELNIPMAKRRSLSQLLANPAANRKGGEKEKKHNNHYLENPTTQSEVVEKSVTAKVVNRLGEGDGSLNLPVKEQISNQ